MQLVQSDRQADLTALSDIEIEAYFAEAGLVAEIVEHCDDATCPSCCAPEYPARAA